MSDRINPERPWATGVLVFSGAISLTFNVRHSVHATELPAVLAVLYGAGPVMLAAMQSHVVALQAARGELVGGWRKTLTFGLVIGALALSFLGIYDLLQHTVTDPIPYTPLNEPAILTPIVVDLMALAALHELLRPAQGSDLVAQTHVPDQVRTDPAEQVPAPLTGLLTTEFGGLTHPGFRTGPDPTPAQTWSPDRSAVQVQDPQIAGSRTSDPDRPSLGSEAQVQTRHADPVPDQGPAEATEPVRQADTDQTQTRRSRTSPKKRTRTKPLDRLDEAKAVDASYLAEHGRHIPAEKLAGALRIGKPAALELVKQVRGAQMTIAK